MLILLKMDIFDLFCVYLMIQTGGSPCTQFGTAVKLVSYSHIRTSIQIPFNSFVNMHLKRIVKINFHYRL